MNREFTFKLETEEYLEYLRFQMANGKANRGKRLWIATSLPAVIACTIIFLRLFTDVLWMCAATAMVVVWVAVLAPQIWQSFVRRRIGLETLEKMNIRGFSQVTLQFEEHGVICREKTKRSIPYREIQTLFCTPSTLVFVCGGGAALLVPLRLFDGKEELKQFVIQFERCWAAQRNAQAASA